MTVAVDFEFSGSSVSPEEMRLVQMIFGDLLGELLDQDRE
jgi:hypothetical protein